jgi:hypothetical protein
MVSQAENIIFRDGMPQRAEPFNPVYDPPSVPPYCLLNAQIGETNYWIYAGSSTTYAVQSTVHTDITHASGLQTNMDVSKFSLGLLNGVPYFNNALNEPMYWDGNVVNKFVTLPGWVATESCAALVAHRFHLFALGIDGPAGNFPDQVKWSDAAAPGNVPSTWVAAPTNEAGDSTLSDTPGAIITGANLRDALMIYKNGSIHRADYIGGQEIYGFRTLFVEAGALSRHAVADINGRHLVVTDGDIVVTDGTNISSIAERRRKRFLFNQIDQDNFQNLVVTYNRAKNEAWICFPESANSLCTRAMIYDVANDAWGDRELPGIAFAANGIINDTASDETWDVDEQVWDADTSIWNSVNFSLSSRDLVIADPTATRILDVGKGAESMRSILSRYSMDFGEGERLKFIKRIHLRIDADPAVEFKVRIGTQMATEDSILWGATQTYNSNQQYANVLAMGRYVSWEISVNNSAPFRITGIDIEYELRGYH